MANRSFVVSLNSLVNSFVIFQNKLRIGWKVTEISNHDPLTPSIRQSPQDTTGATDLNPCCSRFSSGQSRAPPPLHLPQRLRYKPPRSPPLRTGLCL